MSLSQATNITTEVEVEALKYFPLEVCRHKCHGSTALSQVLRAFIHEAFHQVRGQQPFESEMSARKRILIQCETGIRSGE